MVIPSTSVTPPATGPCHLPAPATGRIFDIKRFSSHDGPGIRSTVFFTGCPLRCAWCHNPEAFACHETDAGTPHIRNLTVPILIRELERDISFFDTSHGGVTLSGGEPLFQAHFALDLLRACRARDLHTALDTSGCVDPAILTEAATLTNLVLYDLKSMDPATHCQWTGVSNQRILDNLRLLHAMPVEVWIRLPLIPGVNDDDANLDAMIAFLTPTRFRHISILPYHEIASAKYQRLGLPNRMTHVKPPTPEHIQHIHARFTHAGLNAHIGR